MAPSVVNRFYRSGRWQLLTKDGLLFSWRTLLWIGSHSLLSISLYDVTTKNMILFFFGE